MTVNVWSGLNIQIRMWSDATEGGREEGGGGCTKQNKDKQSEVKHSIDSHSVAVASDAMVSRHSFELESEGKVIVTRSLPHKERAVLLGRQQRGRRLLVHHSVKPRGLVELRLGWR
jgi:hypothetical protein